MKALEHLMNVITPYNCLVCGVEGKLICNWCQPDCCPTLPPRCYKCFRLTTNSEVCGRCRRVSSLKHVWVCADYQDIAKKLIHKYKFQQARAASQIITEFMCQALPYLENDLIVPIPTATSRIRSRGFDHSQLLAKNLSSKTNLRYNAALARSGQTKQVGNKRAQRQQQLKDMFWVKQDVKGMKILLVDDVLTTGATIEEAARTLKKAGAKTINAVVFAQKL